MPRFSPPFPRPLSRRGFLIAAALSAPAASLLAQNADDDVILRAMRTELERSRQLRVVGGGGDDTPYFISYTLDDNDSFNVSATFGAVTSTSRNRYRLPIIEVRVGSYAFDNTGHVFSGLYSGSRFDTEPLPLDNDYRSLRESLWLATDFAYKAAVESIARKRAALNNAVASPDNLADFGKADPLQSLSTISRGKMDEAAWTARIAKLSGLFTAYPEVLACGVEFHLNQDTTYVVNTEGTTIRFADDTSWLNVRAEGQAADGMILRDGFNVQAPDPAKFPNDSDLQQTLQGIARNIQALTKAPLGELYSGPVLLEPLAAAQLMAQLVGDHARVTRKPISDPGRNVNVFTSEFEGRLGSRVVPDWMDVVDDPTQTTWQGKALLGSYKFDFEGVRPQAVSLIEKGVLKGFLSTRQPVKNALTSNGHARLPGAFGTRTAAISNLFIKAAETKPLAELKARLIQLCKDRDKPYGILIRKLDFPFSGGNGDLQGLLSGRAQSGGSVSPVSPPVLAYRVYPDGREELVRGLRFNGVSTRSLRDILAASSETTVFDYLNNGAPLARSGVGGYIAATAVVSPGLLFDELELDRAQEQLQRPAIVPPPTTAAKP